MRSLHVIPSRVEKCNNRYGIMAQYEPNTIILFQPCCQTEKLKTELVNLIDFGQFFRDTSKDNNHAH